VALDDPRGQKCPLPPKAGASLVERVNTVMGWRGGHFPLEILRRVFTQVGPLVLADTPGGREELRELVDPRLRDIVDELSPVDPSPARSFSSRGIYTAAGAGVDILNTALRLRDNAGQHLGTAVISKPAVGMAVLMRITAMGDRGHFERMEQVAKPGRRPAAVLFADLESSSALSRRLSTASYFSFGRRMTCAADQCVIDAGGLIGRHVGDGVVAFFLVETAVSESAAARSCIQAARALREATVDVAARSELVLEDLLWMTSSRLGRWGVH
jgi:hypothetical protein